MFEPSSSNWVLAAGQRMAHLHYVTHQKKLVTVKEFGYQKNVCRLSVTKHLKNWISSLVTALHLDSQGVF